MKNTIIQETPNLNQGENNLQTNENSLKFQSQSQLEQFTCLHSSSDDDQQNIDIIPQVLTLDLLQLLEQRFESNHQTNEQPTQENVQHVDTIQSKKQKKTKKQVEKTISIAKQSQSQDQHSTRTRQQNNKVQSQQNITGPAPLYNSEQFNETKNEAQIPNQNKPIQEFQGLRDEKKLCNPLLRTDQKIKQQPSITQTVIVVQQTAQQERSVRNNNKPIFCKCTTGCDKNSCLCNKKEKKCSKYCHCNRQICCRLQPCLEKLKKLKK